VAQVLVKYSATIIALISRLLITTILVSLLLDFRKRPVRHGTKIPPVESSAAAKEKSWWDHLTPLLIPLLTASIAAYMAVAVARVNADRESQQRCATAIESIRSNGSTIYAKYRRAATSQELQTDWPALITSIQLIGSACGRIVNASQKLRGDMQYYIDLAAVEQLQLRTGLWPNASLFSSVQNFCDDLDRALNSAAPRKFVVFWPGP
jgi:hypothetical protein